jgi:DNA-binding transcriptional ArsR family regulator
MMKIVNESPENRRMRILKLLRSEQWLTIGYIRHHIGVELNAVRGDLHCLEDEGLLELTLALNIGEKDCQGVKKPTAVRITMAKLTTAGKKKRSGEED